MECMQTPTSVPRLEVTARTEMERVNEATNHRDKIFIHYEMLDQRPMTVRLRSTSIRLNIK